MRVLLAEIAAGARSREVTKGVGCFAATAAAGQYHCQTGAEKDHDLHRRADCCSIL